MLPIPSYLKLLSLLVLLVVHAVASGQEKSDSAAFEPIITNEYAVFPVTTELQRELLQNDTIEVCVLVNGAAFREVDKIDRFLPMMEQLQKKLSNLPKVNSSGVVFRCIESTNDDHPFSEVQKRLEELSQACEEVGYYAGYLNVKSSRTFHADDFDWRQWIDKAQAAANSTDSQEEPVTGNERVQVFFVRTFLSHLLANADAIVTILPVVRTAGSFPDEFLPDLEKYLLPEKGDKLRKAMLLRISFTPSLADEIDAWIENLEARRGFARKLGFEGCNVSPGPTSEPDGLTQGPATRLAIKVKVMGPDGQPVPNPKFETRTYPNTGVETTHSPEGTIFKIAGRPRFFHFMIKMPGYAPYIGRWDASDHPESLPTEFTAKLGKGWRIGGIVVDDKGQPVAGAVVNPSIEFEKRPGDTQQFGTGDRMTTDADGRWSYPSVPDTDQEVQVEISHPDVMPGWIPLARTTYELERNKEPHVEIRMSRGIVLTGRVVDDKESPIVGAQLRTQISNVLRQASTDKEGNFTLTGCRAGPTRVVITAPGKATMLEIVDVAVDMEPLKITMQPGGHLRIRVLDPDGKPSPKARVFLQEWKGSVSYFEFDHINQYADDHGVWEWNEAPLDEFVADIAPRQGMQLPRQKFKARAEEYVVKLNQPLEISGTVIDAATKEAIKEFRVVPGRAYAGRESFWNENDAFEVTNGKFSQRITYPGEGHLVRVEAQGYKPAVSREIKPTEGAVMLTIELEKGNMIEATVLRPDGEPALEAVAYLARPGSQVMIENGRIREEQTYAPSLDLDKAGKFRFMKMDGPFGIVIVDDSGFAHVKSTDGPIPAEIKLQPWAKLMGQFLVGSKPAANTSLELMSEALNSRENNGPRVFTSYYLTTDEEGCFAGDRIFPGKARVGRRIVRMVNEGATEVTSSSRVKVELKAGETAEIRLGGTGRPVIGQLLPVEGSTEEPQWRFASIHVTAGKFVKQPESPPKGISPEERTQWWQEWIKTEAGKTWQKQNDEYQKTRDESPSFSASVDRNGKFHIDDMPAGDYELSVRFNEHSAGIVSRYAFTVPPMEGDRSDEPLDLGEIRLEKPDPRVE